METGDKKHQEFAKEYLSSLVDLTYNSKPLIDMLTILAEENIEHGQVIVDAVEQHISKVIFCFVYIFTAIVFDRHRECACVWCCVIFTRNANV